MDRNERMQKMAKRVQKIVENDTTFKNAFNNFENGYAILQLPIDIPYKFRNYEDVTEYLKTEPNRNDYKMLFADTCMSMEDLTNAEIIEVLEGIFIRFNSEGRPTEDDNYYGTSLSVSDVIVLKINNEVTAYYVDSFGFKKLENFEV